MKRLFLVAILAVSLTGLYSCQKENSSVTGPKVSLSLEQMEQEEGDKTLYDPSTGLFYWKSTDKLMVYDADGRNIVYTDPDADGQYDASTGTFSGHTNFVSLAPSYATVDFTGFNSIDENSSLYHAFYPSYYVKKEGNQFIYTIPAKQLIDNNFDVNKIDQMHLTRFPMARQTTSHCFKMMNLCGGLKLTLTKPGVSVKSIEFRARGNQQVTGPFTVTFSTVGSNSGVPALNQTAVNSSTKSITIEFNQPINIENGHVFYIPLPPATYNGYEIIITDENNQVATLRSSGNLVINRNKIRPLVCSETTFTGSRSFKEGHGRFSISDNQQVYVAPGNLQWNNGNWQFANEQYEILTTCGTQRYTPDDYNWDLFHFSVEKVVVQHPLAQGGYAYDWNSVSSVSPGNNNNYGRSTDITDYTSEQLISEGKTLHAVYRNWGLAFGESSNWMNLSLQEYNYLVEDRITRGKCHCTVGGTSNASYCRLVVIDDYGVEHAGLLLFPDNWANGYTDASIASAINWSSGWTVNGANTTWSDNGLEMPITAYRILEEAGCAFLPATGKAANYSGGFAIGCEMQNLCLPDAICYYWTRDVQTESYEWGHYRMTNTRWSPASCPAYAWRMDNSNNAQGLFANNHNDQQLQIQNFCAVRLFMPVPNE